MYQCRFELIIVTTGMVAVYLLHRTNGQLTTTTTVQSAYSNHRYYQQNDDTADYQQQSPPYYRSQFDYVQPLTQQNGFTPMKTTKLLHHQHNNTIRGIRPVKLNRRQHVANTNDWRRRSDYPHHIDYHENYDDAGGHYDVHHYTAPIVRPVRYHHHVPYYADAPSPKFDITHLGLLAIFKLILLKIKAFGLFKLLLLIILKFPIIVFTLGFKFLIILKLIKLVKLLTLPALIPLIIIAILPLIIFLPLLLAPLLPLVLLPLLLPLLLMLPVPVLTPATGKRRRRRSSSDVAAGRGVQDDVLHLVRRVLESEQCIERVACQLASNAQAKDYAPYIAW